MERLFCKIFLPLMLIFSVSAFANADEKMRVGFFQFDGYHMESKSAIEPDNVRRSGYGYDILQLLIPYTDWKYDYVGYKKDWSTMLDMLENGEIDLLTSAVRNQEREKKFDFSSRPIGFSSTILTVKAGYEKYHAKDYANWNGMKVGVLADNSKNKVFRDFAQDKGFQYKEITFCASPRKLDKLHWCKTTCKLRTERIVL